MFREFLLFVLFGADPVWILNFSYSKSQKYIFTRKISCRWVFFILMTCFGSELDPDSFSSVDPGGQNDPQKYKKVNKFHVSKFWMFSWSLDVIYEGIGISKLQFSALNFSHFWSLKPWIRIRNQWILTWNTGWRPFWQWSLIKSSPARIRIYSPSWQSSGSTKRMCSGWNDPRRVAETAHTTCARTTPILTAGLLVRSIQVVPYLHSYR